LDRLFDLVEARELSLRAGKPPFQILNAARLFNDIAGLGFDALLETCDLSAVAGGVPVALVAPGGEGLSRTGVLR
jgi:hypothetical protein